MNFILGKVFVNINTVLQNHCTQCLYWLNFFFWVYIAVSVLAYIYGNENKKNDIYLLVYIFNH